MYTTIAMKFQTIFFMLTLLLADQLYGKADSYDKRTVKYSKSLIGKIDKDLYTDVSVDSIPLLVKRYIKLKTSEIMQKNALPFKNTSLIIKKYDSKIKNENDIIFLKWKVDKLDVEAFFSVNAVDISIPINDIKASDSKSLDLKLKKILKINGINSIGNEWNLQVQWPLKLQDGIEFSTNDTLNLDLIRDWHDKVNFYFANQRLHIIVAYVSFIRIKGPRYLPEPNWFENGWAQQDDLLKRQNIDNLVRIDSTQRSSYSVDIMIEIEEYENNSRDKATVYRAAVQGSLPIEYAYKKRLKVKKDLEGEILFKCVIDSHGTVTDFKLLEDGLRDSIFIDAVQNNVKKRWKFKSVDKKDGKKDKVDEVIFRIKASKSKIDK